MLVVGLYARHSMVPSFALIAVALIVHVRWHRGHWPVPSPLVLAALLLLTGWLTIRTLIGEPCYRCAAAGWQMVPFIWLLAVAAAAAPLSIFAEPELRRQLFIWTAMVTMLTAGLLAVELLFDAPVYRFVAGRPADAIVGPARYNRTAALLTLIIWPCAAWYVMAAKQAKGDRSWRSNRQVLALLLLGFAAVAAVNALSDSETSAAGFILALLFTIACYRIIGLGLLFVTAAAVALLLGFQHLADILPAVLAEWPVAWADSLWHRFEIWRHTAAAIAERPWQGWGFDGYREVPFASADREAARFMFETPTHPHNAGLQLRVELGLAGSLFGVLVVLAVARAIWVGPVAARPWALGAVVTAAIIAELAYGLWQGSWLAMLGLVMVLHGLLAAPATPPTLPTPLTPPTNVADRS